MLKVAPASAEKLHWTFLQTVMWHVPLANGPEVFTNSYSATLGFLLSTDSGSLLNRLVKASAALDDALITPITLRFSQDMSLINQALPMVMLNFAIGEMAFFST